MTGCVVALRKESVDRNLVGCIDRTIDIIVALRKESVDRNLFCLLLKNHIFLSLSARRAWIEISTRNQPGRPKTVALRKESVDRNYTANAVDQILPGSLSARRAWIEITLVASITT